MATHYCVTLKLGADAPITDAAHLLRMCLCTKPVERADAEAIRTTVAARELARRLKIDTKRFVPVGIGPAPSNYMCDEPYCTLWLAVRQETAVMPGPPPLRASQESVAALPVPDTYGGTFDQPDAVYPSKVQVYVANVRKCSNAIAVSLQPNFTHLTCYSVVGSAIHNALGSYKCAETLLAARIIGERYAELFSRFRRDSPGEAASSSEHGGGNYGISGWKLTAPARLLLHIVPSSSPQTDCATFYLHIGPHPSDVAELAKAFVVKNANTNSSPGAVLDEEDEQQADRDEEQETPDAGSTGDKKKGGVPRKFEANGAWKKRNKDVHEPAARQIRARGPRDARRDGKLPPPRTLSYTKHVIHIQSIFFGKALVNAATDLFVKRDDEDDDEQHGARRGKPKSQNDGEWPTTSDADGFNAVGGNGKRKQKRDAPGGHARADNNRAAAAAGGDSTKNGMSRKRELAEHAIVQAVDSMLHVPFDAFKRLRPHAAIIAAQRCDEENKGREMLRLYDIQHPGARIEIDHTGEIAFIDVTNPHYDGEELKFENVPPKVAMQMLELHMLAQMMCAVDEQ